MTAETYKTIESYMCACMCDSAHDKEHVYRVLYNALDIANAESGVDYDILITACLLHDIGRAEQLADPTVCHAEAGSQKAYAFLLEQGCTEQFARQVRHCILAHRFRKNTPPETLEAKILFDADKLDVTGAMGIARTLQYQGTLQHPLYTRRSDGAVSTGEGDQDLSFFREYKFKLENLYDRFYTARGAALAKKRQPIARSFYESLYREASSGDPQLLKAVLTDL